MKKSPLVYLALAYILSVQFMCAQESHATSLTDDAELAKKLSNPVASLISFPLQNNLDVGIGTFNGYRNTLNIEPVLPMVEQNAERGQKRQKSV